ncbi:MAG: UDP-N-acetylmuramate--L-alanine ligase [Thermoanaerobaculia bacterium]
MGEHKSIHFVGIGGIGMSGLAEIAAAEGLAVSGCDMKASATTARLVSRGIDVAVGHDPAHVDRASLIVISSAVKRDNPEVVKAGDAGVPVMRRAEFLGAITARKKTVAIAGTHGKTTTTAMASYILTKAGLEPTIVVGGMMHDLQTNAVLGKGDVLVVEADEYDRSFLAFHPTIAVVTNIEADHLDIYRDLDDIRGAFRQFARLVPEAGVLIGCSDEPEVEALLAQSGKRAVRYGIGDGATLRATNLRFSEGTSTYELESGSTSLGTVTLKLPGEHYVRNSLAAIAAALELGVPMAEIAAALATFSGVERRFERLGEHRGSIVIDDYAHHPTEIRATLAAARGSFPGRRIVALFQPHLYSRTRDFAREFAEALAEADEAWVAPIYPAREQPIEGVDASTIANAAGGGNVRAMEGTNAEIAARFGRELAPGSVFVSMGAGDIHEVAEILAGGAR